ncbi:DUF1513 domain-containing protein [Halomonas sp.]|uniref:DUF1513 domain-containing protein n=1 Tax=Halomonas sp. TaxID=1486246 RepID=UPI003A103402
MPRRRCPGPPGLHRVSAGRWEPVAASPCRNAICHSGCRRPGRPQISAALQASRPIGPCAGRHRGNARSPVSTAGPAYHFYGHGAFSPDGRYLYATANRIEDGAGVIRVFDAGNDYALEGEIDLAWHRPPPAAPDAGWTDAGRRAWWHPDSCLAAVR